MRKITDIVNFLTSILIITACKLSYYTYIISVIIGFISIFITTFYFVIGDYSKMLLYIGIIVFSYFVSMLCQQFTAAIEMLFFLDTQEYIENEQSTEHNK